MAEPEAEKGGQKSEARQVEAVPAFTQQGWMRTVDDYWRRVKWAGLSVSALAVILAIWGIFSSEEAPSRDRVPGAEASETTYKSPREVEVLSATHGVTSCAVEQREGLTQEIVTYAAGDTTYAINGQARQRASSRGWVDGKTIFSPDQMQAYLSEGLQKCVAISLHRNSSTVEAKGGRESPEVIERKNLGGSSLEMEGARDGRKFAEGLRRIGEPVDGTACAVGMALEDKARAHLSQVQAETYAKAFANACMGRRVF